MENVINLGKFAYDGNRKINRVTVEWELRKINKPTITIDGEQVSEYLEFAASGNIWNSRNTDIVCGGQCLDTIKKLVGNSNKEFNTIYKVWQKYHLNGFNAGTKLQSEALENTGIKDYKERCEYLESKGILTDPKTGIKYGHTWYVEIIPDDVIHTLESLN